MKELVEEGLYILAEGEVLLLTNEQTCSLQLSDSVCLKICWIWQAGHRITASEMLWPYYSYDNVQYLILHLLSNFCQTINVPGEGGQDFMCGNSRSLYMGSVDP